MNLKLYFNKFLTKYGYYHRKIRLSNKPQVYAIELTNYCNISCLMCPHTQMKRKIGFMDFSLFKKIINQIKDCNESVWLNDFGESLFHPQLEEFINYCSQNSIKPCLSTNATVLDEKRAMMILDTKLDKIILSLDGATKETYQKIRQGAIFEVTKDNIMRFLKLKKELNKRNPYAIVQIIRMCSTENELCDFKQQWRGLADEVTFQRFCTWSEQVKSIIGLAEQKDLYFPHARDNRYPCALLWTNGIVLWNGDFVPCCRDFDAKMVFGNLQEQTLLDIWNSPKIKGIRQAQIEDNYGDSICKDCLEWIGEKEDRFFPFSVNFLNLILKQM